MPATFCLFKLYIFCIVLCEVRTRSGSVCIRAVFGLDGDVGLFLCVCAVGMFLFCVWVWCVYRMYLCVFILFLVISVQQRTFHTPRL